MDSKSARQEAVTCLKQNLIMDAALKVISRDGYLAAKLEDIAEEAGFSKAALYHYFPDREALFLNIILREYKLVSERFQEITESEITFSEALRKVITVAYNSVIENVKLYGDISLNLMMLTYANMLTKHEDLFNVVIERKNEISNHILKLVERAKESGVFTIPVDNEMVACFINAIIQTVIMDIIQKHKCGVQAHDFNKTVESLLTLLSPWINETPEHIPAQEEVNRA